MRYLLITLLILVTSCRKNLKDTIVKDDFKIAMPGNYPGWTIPCQETSFSEEFRKTFDDDQRLLNLIVQRVFPQAGDLEYRYTSIRKDEENNRSIIRYFGKITGDPVIAGYQIQFVFDARNQLISVCVSAVPLE
ncbi:MAG TPA: hypothetical protein EYP58_05720 [bacterium (Candidatus Stahlbacteria)]|nr:hypothetical protein [Candidatus Stahlbacteria bacterium]